VNQLLAVATGTTLSDGETQHSLKSFPLESHHVDHKLIDGQKRLKLGTPTEFHEELCTRIRQAKQRILLATLYIGPAASSLSIKEAEFLEALNHASCTNLEIKILMDASRGRRPVFINKSTNTKTCSASAVYSRIARSNMLAENGVFLCQVLGRTKAWLPSPLNEVAGVFHMKVYIIDDCLILSGANLSEEYFTNRHDRYLMIVNGGNGLVDCYADIVRTFCHASTKFEEQASKLERIFSYEGLAKRSQFLIKNLTQIMCSTDNQQSNVATQVVAYAVPTIQIPDLNHILPFPTDSQTLHRLLAEFASISHNHNLRPSIRLSSAYLNPTQQLIEVLETYNRMSDVPSVYLISAGTKSHGFAPRKGGGTGRDWIPFAFQEIAYLLEKSFPGGVHLFDRDNWTFHAKGLWFSTDDLAASHQMNSLALTSPSTLHISVHGSGNYGCRSHKLDVESNCVLILPSACEKSDATWLQRAFADEWNKKAHFSHPITTELASTEKLFTLGTRLRVKMCLPLLKPFL